MTLIAMWCRTSQNIFSFIITATTEFYTLSLHDALPISARSRPCRSPFLGSSRSIPPLPIGHMGRGLGRFVRSEEHTSELQSRRDLVCRLLLEKKNTLDADHRKKQ